jgi:hypothetical protein
MRSHDHQLLRTRVYNAVGKKLIYFNETNNLEILDGNFGSDERREFTFINKLGSSSGIYFIILFLI